MAHATTTPHTSHPTPAPRNAEGGPARLILFPGLGADERLLMRQRAHFGDRLVIPAWPKPLALEGLLEFAGRWALEASAGRVAGVSLTPPYYIGGVSFGGMFAISAAAHLSPAPAGLFLIASARNRHALPGRTRFLEATLSRWPAPMLRAIMRSFAGLIVKRERLSPEHESLVRAMAADAGVPLARWQGRACVGWRQQERSVRATGGGLIPIHQLHGDRDWILPLVKSDADEVVRGAGHLVNMTHAEAVNRYLDVKMGVSAGAAEGPSPGRNTAGGSELP